MSGVNVSQGDGGEEYCCSVYYMQPMKSSVYINFVVTRSADFTSMRDYYTSKGALLGPDFGIRFVSDSVHLDIQACSPELYAVKGVWRVVPLESPLIVHKKEVDNYKPGHRIPSCQMHAYVEPKINADQIPVLLHTVRVLGTELSKRSFIINYIPTEATS